MVRKKEFIRRISDDCRLRHKHLRFKTQIIGFVVQLEIFSENKWYPVVRYDTAHGVAHKDLIHYDGKVNKTPVFYLDYSDALVFAESDLIANWQIYKNMFLEEVKSHE